MINSVQFSHSDPPCSLRPHGLHHARLPCPSSTPRYLLKLMFIESVMPSNHLILFWPLLLLPSIFPSIRVFSNESVLCNRWPNCHPVYLTYMQSRSCKMPGWVKHKLESRLPGEISVTSDMQVIPPHGRK